LIVDNLSQLISVLFINFAEALAVKLHKKRAPCVAAQGASITISNKTLNL